MAEAQRSLQIPADAPPPRSQAELGGRYEVYGEIASGGMASVQYGRLRGPHGFTRAVAIKRLHPQFSKEPEFLSMFIDEAHLSARLVHANIIHTLDVIQAADELALVMEYVHGESLWTLLRLARDQGRAIPLQVASSLLASALHGLHAAHEARADSGAPLGIVHRDVSPQNILVGSDGIPRLLDFGIAKALGRLRSTPSGEIKGKLGYIAPEQLQATHVDRRTDVYGASAVLWETLTGRPLFDGPNEPAVVHRVLYETIAPPSAHRREIPAAIDAIVLRGLQRDASQRFPSARAMALAIEQSTGLATQSEIVRWLQGLAGPSLAARSRRLAAMLQRDPSALAPQLTAAESTRRLAAVIGSGAAGPELTRSRAPAHRRARLLGVGVGVVFVAAASAALWTVRGAFQPRTGERPVPVEQPGAISMDEPVSSARAEPAEREPREAGPPAIEPARAEQPPAVAAGASVPRERPQRAARQRAAAATRPREVQQAASACDPFYWIDDRGIRRPKPECL